MSYFCHYNINFQQIIRISKSSLKDSESNDVIVFEIKPDIALSVLSGETNSSDWVAVQNHSENDIGGWKLILKNDKENALSKNSTSLFYKIPLGDFISTDDLHIMLSGKIGEQKLEFYFLIDSILKSPEKSIEFFITKENDPSFLLNSIIIDLGELRTTAGYIGTDENIKHVRKIVKTINFPAISIFTTKIFSNISMEIIHNDNS